MLNKITHRLILGFLIPIPFLIVLGAILYTSIAHLVKLLIPIYYEVALNIASRI
jgi:hypothetical protein